MRVCACLCVSVRVCACLCVLRWSPCVCMRVHACCAGLQTAKYRVTFWEPVLMTHRLALAAIFVFMDGVVRCYVQLGVTTVFLLAHVLVKPMLSGTVQRMQALLLTCLLLVNGESTPVNSRVLWSLLRVCAQSGVLLFVQPSCSLLWHHAALSIAQASVVEAALATATGADVVLTSGTHEFLVACNALFYAILPLFGEWFFSFQPFRSHRIGSTGALGIP